MTEHGDRAAFLAGARARLAQPPPVNQVHAPPVRGDAAGVPAITYRNLDAADLAGSFARALEQASGTCHLTPAPAVPPAALAEIAASLPSPTAVVSDEPEALRTGLALGELGVDVTPYDRVAGAAASLGVTSAVAAIASTGSVVVDAQRAGGRGASLLPRVHLCVVPASRLVATPADVLRALSGRPEHLPSNLVLITGPSRTGDIEQLLTLGVHGPIAVHVVLTGSG
jgi:L-lactate dehydrogenase complex protein LldG